MPRARDRERTRAKILDAAERLLTTAGYGALGINAIAAEAGVDKVLIYRYFGGLPQLLTALARDGKLWPSLAEIAPAAEGRAVDGEAGSLGALALRLLRAELAALRERPLAQQALAWELAERNPLTEELVAARTARHGEMLDAVQTGRRPPYVDASALIALLSAGLTYLALIARTSDRYMDLELGSDDGWRRVDRTLATVVRALLEPTEV